MANHGSQRSQWKGEGGSHSSRKSLLEEKKIDKTNVHSGWPSSLECFNERGIEADVAASRSLKFLKDDFISSQVAPSRTEKIPVSSMDTNLYRKFSRFSLRDERKKGSLPNLKPELRRKDRKVCGSRSSFYCKDMNHSYTPSKLCCSPSPSLTPPCIEHLPDLVSVKELPTRKKSNYTRDREEKNALFNGLRSSFHLQSDKVFMSCKDFVKSNKRNCICSTSYYPGTDLGGTEKIHGDIPRLGSVKSMNQRQNSGEAKTIHNESKYLASKHSLSPIVGEDQSFNEVVWRTIPTSIKPTMRRTPSGIFFCNQETNENFRFPYLTEKQLGGSNAAGDRSKESSENVVWVRFPSLLHNHPTTPYFKGLMGSHSKSDTKRSLHDSENSKCFNNDCVTDGDNFHNQLSFASGQENLQEKRLNSLRSRSPCKVNLNSCRTGGTGSCVSGMLVDSLIDGPKSEGTLHSLCATEASSFVEGSHSLVEPHIVANRKGAQSIARANGVPSRVLVQMSTEAVSPCDVSKSNPDLGKELKPLTKCMGRGSDSEIQTSNISPLVTELNSFRIKMGSGVENSDNIDRHSSIPYANQMLNMNVKEFESLKQTVGVSGKCMDVQQPIFPHKIHRIVGKSGKKLRVIRNPKKEKVNKINQATIELLRSIYLNAPDARAHHLPLPARASPRLSLAQKNRDHDCEIESYLDNCHGNTDEVGRENTGKKSERFQSLIMSEDPFSYLLRLHGFWGETNYY